MKVVIVGSGNVATVLGKKIQESGAEIVQVISRTEKHARTLAGLLHADYTDNAANIVTTYDLCLVAVGDEQIGQVANVLPRTSAMVVHTAGSVSKEVLKPVSQHYGVLYPLQTLSRHSQMLPSIPVIIDGSTEQVKHTLFDFACRWSPLVAFANDEQRANIHLAAVIANNFTNHLMVLTEDFCNREGVDFKLLFPLISETVSKLDTTAPALLQTGPAVRGDIATIDKHLQLLNKKPALRKLYLKITESIIVHSKLNTINQVDVT